MANIYIYIYCIHIIYYIIYIYRERSRTFYSKQKDTKSMLRVDWAASPRALRSPTSHDMQLRKTQVKTFRYPIEKHVLSLFITDSVQQHPTTSSKTLHRTCISCLCDVALYSMTCQSFTVLASDYAVHFSCTSTYLTFYQNSLNQRSFFGKTSERLITIAHHGYGVFACICILHFSSCPG